jgi:predicted alpha/beta hydrolase family esterase
MTYVFLAGIGNSEPQHWQSLWFRALGGRWVDHADWEHPDAATWVADLDAALRDVAGAKILIAHSLGCLLAVEWARRHRDPDVRGSFLVAPPDPHGASWPADVINGFAPAGDAARPPLPALVVASTTDQYASIASARAAARCWGAEFADVGAQGHINLASNIGAWGAGRALFDHFVARCSRRP